MRYLKEKELDRLIISLKQPVLGICLGQQLMCRYSEEGDTSCMGIFDSEVRLSPQVETVPHMGWNNSFLLKVWLFEGFSCEGMLLLCPISFYPEISSCTTAVCDYILPFQRCYAEG